MKNYKNLTKDLTKTLNTIVQLNNEVSSTYDLVKQRLNICKVLGVSLIGNPLLGFENQLIELTYLVMQHISNCKTYTDLLHSCDHDRNLKKQVYGLRVINIELRDRYEAIKSDLAVAATHFSPRLIRSA